MTRLHQGVEEQGMLTDRERFDRDDLERDELILRRLGDRTDGP